MFVLANMWFQTLMRQFFFNIDKIVFNFISTIYDFLITIARTSVLSQADIASMADRIYKLLAVFMIFKVTFSLIMYVVNPDDFSDKSKGVGKLGTNVVISLSLLILTPYIFNYAYQLQTIILEDNSLSALIFGESQENTNQAPFESAGDKMAYITMQPFFMPNSAIDELYECSQLTTRDSNGNEVFNKDCSGLNSDYKSTNDDDSLYALTKDEDGEENTRFTEQTLKNYVAGVSVGNLGLMFRQDMAIATDSENTEFIIDYKFLFSTVLGIVVILLLVTFCMDVALRSIKLAFLQLIAPIPIISFVDPKSGKDGMFKKWAEMCGKTYISLFIRLLAIYFAAFIISKIDRMVDIIDGSYVSNLLVKIFIIIGALMFAKQFPEILKGLVGVKLDGGFTLNPLKKMENEMIGGKQVSKIGKGVGKYTGRLAKGVGTAALVGGASAITGHGFRGTGKAIRGAWKGDKFGQNFSNSYGAAKDRHRQVEEMKANGVTPGQVRREKLYNAFHGTTRAEKVQQVADKSKAIQSNYDTIKNQAVACDSNDNNVLNRKGRVIKSAKTISKELDEMKKTQINRADIASKIDKGKITADFQAELNDKTKYDKFLQDFNLDIKNYSDREIVDVNGNKRTITAQQQFDQAKNDAIEKVANSRYDQTVDKAYNEAIAQQKDAIKEKEADLEFRIKALANGMSTGVESADKVIAEAKATMGKLAESVNKTGEEVDDKFVKISTDTSDVVTMMKQSKGAAAQATSGKMSDIKDVAQYTKKNK